MRLIRYVPVRAGIAAIAKSREVDQHLERRAQRVAEVAQSQYDADPPNSGEVVVRVEQAGSDTPHRARVAVIAAHPIALAIEADRRVLGGSLDAARG